MRIVYNVATGEVSEYPDEPIEPLSPEEQRSQQIQQIQTQIDQLESKELLPRITREFMLKSLEGTYSADQLSQTIGYTKLKAFDDQIVQLRAQLKALGG